MLHSAEKKLIEENKRERDRSPDGELGELENEYYNDDDSRSPDKDSEGNMNENKHRGDNMDMMNMRQMSENNKSRTTYNNQDDDGASTKKSEADFDGDIREAEEMIDEIRRRVNHEKENILLMKTKYIQKLDEKNELEKLLAKCINDYKEELWAIKSKMKFVNNIGFSGKDEKSTMSNNVKSKAGNDANKDDAFEMEVKETIREILNIEKQLSLLYDKVFYNKAHRSTNNQVDSRFRMS